MSNPPTVIVVPCYNEAQRLGVDRFRHFADGADGVRFLFVNDGSTDGTPRLLEKACAAHPDIFSMLSLERNLGKAEAVRLGLVQAMDRQPRYVGFWDADLATPLDELPGFLRCLEDQPQLDMVFGSRVNLLGRSVRRNLLRHYVGRVFATFAAFVLRLPIYDTQCGAKLFRVSDELRDICAEPFLSKWIFDVEIVARCIRARRGADCAPVRDIIFEQPLMAWRDVRGSKIRLRDFIVVGLDLLRIHHRYLRRR